ncbi:hypothetical protein PoB_006261700 [Plakobranchus ocellatus]|uniref:Uncharacterized protein n=1 Tax=Plakobranchus ocellatus TaxID=259542 RepID=A0AAV4CW25_9GAST|nr:hypothetical protein PoB_006261700 [Plakobranchus ocellatus]
MDKASENMTILCDNPMLLFVPVADLTGEKEDSADMTLRYGTGTLQYNLRPYLPYTLRPPLQFAIHSQASTAVCPTLSGLLCRFPTLSGLLCRLSYTLRPPLQFALHSQASIAGCHNSQASTGTVDSKSAPNSAQILLSQVSARPPMSWA